MNKTEDEYYSNGCRIQKEINEKGDVVLENYFNIAGNLESTFKYTYNSEGICLEESEYDSKGQQISKTNYTYETNANTIEKTTFKDGKPAEKSKEIFTKKS